MATSDSLAIQGTLENKNIFGTIIVNGSGVNFTGKKEDNKTQPTQDAH